MLQTVILPLRIYLCSQQIPGQVHSANELYVPVGSEVQLQEGSTPNQLTPTQPISTPIGIIVTPVQSTPTPIQTRIQQMPTPKVATTQPMPIFTSAHAIATPIQQAIATPTYAMPTPTVTQTIDTPIQVISRNTDTYTNTNTSNANTKVLLSVASYFCVIDFFVNSN